MAINKVILINSILCAGKALIFFERIKDRRAVTIRLYVTKVSITWHVLFEMCSPFTFVLTFNPCQLNLMMLVLFIS